MNSVCTLLSVEIALPRLELLFMRLMNISTCDFNVPMKSSMEMSFTPFSLNLTSATWPDIGAEAGTDD